jgi:hypothetical protein
MIMRTYGNGTPVFVTEQEDGYTNSPEFVAAMYESGAADDEAANTWSTDGFPNAYQASSAYANAAHRVAEDIEYAEYEAAADKYWEMRDDASQWEY